MVCGLMSSSLSVAILNPSYKLGVGHYNGVSIIIVFITYKALGGGLG